MCHRRYDGDTARTLAGFTWTEQDVQCSLLKKQRDGAAFFELQVGAQIKYAHSADDGVREYLQILRKLKGDENFVPEGFVSWAQDEFGASQPAGRQTAKILPFRRRVYES